MPEAASDQLPGRSPNEMLLVLLLPALTFSLAQTLVLPALPLLAEEFDASTTTTSWVLTGFLLSAAISTPLTGKLGDVFGRRRLLTAVMLVFACGSVISALAESIEMVIAGRVIQGIGGGVFPLAFGIIRDTFPAARVPAGVGMVGAIFGLGAVVGLPLSGLVVDGLGVDWIFLLGLLSVPAAAGAWLLVPPGPADARRGIDWLGAGLLSLTLAAVLVAITRANDWGWGSPVTIGLLVMGVALAAIWLTVEARTARPLIEPDLLRARSVAPTNVAAVLLGFAMFATYILVPSFAQAPERTGYGFGYSLVAAGLLLIPAAGGQFLIGAYAGRLGARIGFRATLVAGAAIIGVSFLALTFEHAHPWQFAVANVAQGVGIAFTLASMANLIVHAVPQADVGIATGINTVGRLLGGAFASAIIAALLAAHLNVDTGLPSEAAYTAAFACSAAAAFAALVCAILVPAVNETLEPRTEVASALSQIR